MREMLGSQVLSVLLWRRQIFVLPKRSWLVESALPFNSHCNGIATAKA